MLQIKNLDTNEPILEIYEPIGVQYFSDGTYSGVSGSELASAINYINTFPNVSRIKLYINSDGGNVSDGMSMYSAIKSSKIPVDTVCVGVCVSMAGVVLQAGKTRQMVKWGQMMIHPPAGGDVKDLNALRETLIKMLCESSGIDEKEMGDIMDSTSWINAENCLEMKLIDSIADISMDEIAPVITKDTTPATAYKSMLAVVNTINQKKKSVTNIKTEKMDKTLNYLGLKSDATDVDILNAIKERDLKAKAVQKGIFNARKAAKKKDDDEPEPDEEPENALAALQNQISNLSKECDDLRNALNAKTQECDALNKAKKDAEDKAKESEAEDVINQAVNAGKITKDSKDAWVGMYIADKDHTVNLLKGIGFNKKNSTITAQAPARESVMEKAPVINGLKQMNYTESSDGESPFRKLQRERMEHAKQAAENFKNKK